MRIEEKEYTKSIDISIWKKGFPFPCTPEKCADYGNCDEYSLLSSGYYHAVISATGH